jgi:hypothetical protein
MLVLNGDVDLWAYCGVAQAVESIPENLIIDFPYDWLMVPVNPISQLNYGQILGIKLSYGLCRCNCSDEKSGWPLALAINSFSIRNHKPALSRSCGL